MHFHVIVRHLCLCQSSVTHSRYSRPALWLQPWLAGVIEKAVNRSDLESRYTVLCVLSIQSNILEDI